VTRAYGIVALACAAHLHAAWLDVPFVRQRENGCGAAAVAMVLQYWNREADPEALHRLLYSPLAKGARASALVRFFEDQRFQTVSFAGGWEDLQEHTGKGRPLIVALASGAPQAAPPAAAAARLRPAFGFKPGRTSAAAALHYVVIAGIESDIALLNDPADRKLRKLDRTSFERSWRASGNWTLLAVPGAAGP